MDAPAAYYRPSGKFSASGALVALASALAAGAVFGGLYALIDVYVPVVGEFSALVAAGAGALAGLVAGRALKAGRVRNVAVAAGVAVVSGLATLYASWVVFLAGLFLRLGLAARPRNLVLHPRLVWHAVRVLDVSGAWHLEHSTPRGLVLWLAWGAEAALLFGLAIFVALKTWGEAAYCEACGSWCAPKKVVGTFAVGDKFDLSRRLEAKDLSALEKLGPPAQSPYLRASLQQCPKCRQTNALTIERVDFARAANGRTNTRSQVWVKRLVVTQAEADELAQLGARVATRSAAA